MTDSNERAGHRSRQPVHAGLRRRLRRAVLKLRPDASLTPFERFDRDGHNDLLLRDLPLDSGSVALDFGGYLGDYTAAVRERYGCRVHVFEPVPEFADRIRARFASDPPVTVHEYGLAEKPSRRPMGLSADGTGEFAAGDAIDVEFRSASEFAEQVPGGIGVAAINIEGGEYELIPALASAGMLARVERVFIQFHDVGPSSIRDRERCREVLGRTHELAWDYDFVWEAWNRKRSP